jgi:type IV secretion system protein VirB3
MQQDGLNEDVLFLACTRPAMWQGVPLEALAINGMITSIIFVVMSNPFYLLIGVVVHYAMRALISHDYNMFTILRLWSATKGRARNTDQWGGSSVSPLPLTKARRKNGNREVRIHV